ncbi:AAA family ATPase [Streptomyces sp. NPDC047803]|uniref:ATP-binding protein n=1 Tax=unclassified Streptomyces TaxID=2593676 RepID=UPI0033DB07F5
MGVERNTASDLVVRAPEGASPRAADPRPDHSPQPRPPRFVGRESELRDVLDALVPGRPAALVVVEGEAGVGKSRLVREALTHREVRSAGGVLTAVCPPFREAPTFGPLIDAVRDGRPQGPAGLGLSPLAGVLRPLLPEWADDLLPAPEAVTDPGAARHRLLRALAELLDRLAVRVLVIEDLHWADDATLDFLLFLTTRPTRTINLVLTYRPEDLPADSLLPRLTSRQAAGTPHIRLALRPLGVADTGELVSSMLDDDHVSDAFSTFLHARTDGLPLALEESVHLLRDRADLVRREEEWVRHALADIAVPPTIRDAVAERVARLDPDARTVLEAAAVLGEPASEELLFTVAGLPADRARPAADAAVRCGLLTDGPYGRLAFRHALPAQAVYDGLTARARGRLHGRAGVTLEAEPQPSPTRLTHHFRCAGDTGRWLTHGERAADLALAAGDQRAAAALVHDLLTIPCLPAQDIVRLVRKVPLHTYGRFHNRDEVVRTLRDCLAGEDLPVRDRAGIHMQLGRILHAAGELRASQEEFGRAIDGLADDPAQAARAMILLGIPTDSPLPVTEHLRWLDHAEELINRAIPAEKRLFYVVSWSTALLQLGEEAGWQPVGGFLLDEDRIAPGDIVQLNRGLLNSGACAMSWGRYADARRLLTCALDQANRHQITGQHMMTAANLVHLDWFQGRWDDYPARVDALAESEDDPRFLAEKLLLHGLYDLAAGDSRIAEERLGTALDEGLRGGDLLLQAEPAGALGRLRLTAGDIGGALAATDRVTGTLTAKGLWVFGAELMPVRAEALLAAGRADDAERLTEAFLRGTADRAIPAAAAGALACRAHLAEAHGPAARAADAWADAAAAWQALPRPYEALLAAAREAMCRIASGASDQGIAQLHGVRRALDTLGARAEADRVAAALRARGEAAPVVWRGGRRGYGDRLSPRETEVVRLLLNGLTNREIAAVLSRSPKTVAAQLKSAMRKSGVTTRTALAVSAAKAGLTPDPVTHPKA